jgi:hypothetical protein
MKRTLNVLLSLSLLNSSPIGWASTPPSSTSAASIDQNSLPSDENWLNLADLEKELQSEKSPGDPFHLVQQDLVTSDGPIPLFSLGESPIIPQFDTLEYAIGKNDFSIIGTLRGKKVARHIFRNLKIHSIQSDTEILFGATTAGELIAIDMVFLKKNAFRGPIPVYKNLITHENFSKPLTMNFWTRGLPPSMLKGIKDDNSGLFPRDRNDQLIFQAGDLIVTRQSVAGSHPVAILSREVLAKNIQERAEELSIRAAITSSEVFESIDPEVLRRLDDAKAHHEISADDLAELALRALPGDAITRLLSQADRLADSNRQYDRATLKEWRTIFPMLLREAQQNDKSLSPNSNLSDQWQKLMAAIMNQGRPALQKPGFFKTYAKTLAAITGVGSAVGATYLADAKSVMLALDYLYAHAVPPILKIAEYRFPLLASVTSLISIIPLVQTLAYLSPYTMATVGTGLKAVSKNLSDQVLTMAAQWRSLGVWQRLVTMGARVYSVISVALWNHLGTLLRQPQLFRTLKLGLNPFTEIRASSDLGKKLALPQNMHLGINNPLASKANLTSQTLKQQQAMQFLAQENLRARHVAFQLVALTLYQRQEIDPATLALLLQSDSKSEKLDAHLFKDLTPERQKEWLALTEVIANDWLQTVRTQGRLFESIAAEEFFILYQTAREKLSKHQNSSVIRKRLAIFKDQTNRFLKKLRQDTLLLGVSDAQILRTVYADPFVADQVKKTFVSDHILVAGLPAFWGDRANPDKALVKGGNADGTDRNLLTFKPEDGSIADLWTNPEHMMDIWINVTGHFFAGGAQQILLYQGEPPVEELNYRPAEQFLIDQKQELEGLTDGTTKWITNALDTRKSALGNIYLKTLVRKLRTVQAGLLLSLTFRYVATNPTLENALMGWYLFFVAGTWSYAWPWTIIGQGNSLEAKRNGAKTEHLMDLQIRLSQALRLKESALSARYTTELLELYAENKPKQEHLLKALGVPPSEQSPTFEAWAQRLLGHSQAHPPFATQPNFFPSWASTWAGAFSTTYLGIPLGILSLDASYMTAPNLMVETVKAAALYGAAYYVIGENGLWSMALNRMETTVNNFRNRLRVVNISGKVSESSHSCRQALIRPF